MPQVALGCCCPGEGITNCGPCALPESTLHWYDGIDFDDIDLTYRTGTATMFDTDSGALFVGSPYWFGYSAGYFAWIVLICIDGAIKLTSLATVFGGSFEDDGTNVEGIGTGVTGADIVEAETTCDPLHLDFTTNYVELPPEGYG